MLYVCVLNFPEYKMRMFPNVSPVKMGISLLNLHDTQNVCWIGWMILYVLHLNVKKNHATTTVVIYILVYIPDFIGHVLSDNSYQVRLLKNEVIKFKWFCIKHGLSHWKERHNIVYNTRHPKYRIRVMVTTAVFN